MCNYYWHFKCISRSTMRVSFWLRRYVKSQNVGEEDKAMELAQISRGGASVLVVIYYSVNILCFRENMMVPPVAMDLQNMVRHQAILIMYFFHWSLSQWSKGLKTISIWFVFVRDGIYNSVADYNSTWRVSSVCVCVCMCVCVSVPGQTLLLGNFWTLWARGLKFFVVP